MLIKFGGKLYYILEDRPPPQPDPYGPDMWGYISNPPYKTDAMVRSLMGKQKYHQAGTHAGAPRPVPKPKVYTPEEAADKLASIKPKHMTGSTDSLMAYNKQLVSQMTFNPRTLSDWLGTGMECTCSTLHTPPCTTFAVNKFGPDINCGSSRHDCGITGCNNSNCEACTTSFYGDIGV